jgi:hypothetical protein
MKTYHDKDCYERTNKDFHCNSFAISRIACQRCQAQPGQ